MTKKSQKGKTFCTKDSVAWLSIPPMEKAPAEISAGELGARIRKALQTSKKAGFVDRKDVEDFQFWKRTDIKGINGFSSFCKRFQCVSFFQNGKTLQITAMVRDSYGAYAEPKEEHLRIKLPVSAASGEALGQAVLKLLHSESMLAEG